MKHKLIRLTALIMAVIMCIPSNITALAAETTATEAQQATYTAAISPAEHGTIVFTGDTGDSRQFNKNDKVDVTLKPDKGYKVSQFKVTNTDTGKVLAQENTKNNRFTFYMPEKNVTISANFDVEESAIEMPEDSGDNSGAEEEDGSDDEDGEPRPEEEELPVESFVDAGTDAPENKTDNVVNMKFSNGVTAHLYVEVKVIHSTEVCWMLVKISGFIFGMLKEVIKIIKKRKKKIKKRNLVPFFYLVLY